MSMMLAVAQNVVLADMADWWSDPTIRWTVIAASAVVLLVMVWGGIRFWLGTTRPPQIKDVHTPTLDRMNANALERFGAANEGEEVEEPAENDAPADLLAVLPEEEKKPAPEEKKDAPGTPA